MPTPMNDERAQLAEQFLREAVYRSRATQAAAGVLKRSGGSVSGPNVPGGSVIGQCGLGERAAIVLDLAERGRELFAQLWPNEIPVEHIDAVHEVMREWIEKQDALDRKRNHFLKAFRQKHGFDRTKYGVELEREYDAGLEHVNAEEDRERREAAERLVEIG